MASHAWNVNWPNATKEQFLMIRNQISEGGIAEENVNGVALYLLEATRQMGMGEYVHRYGSLLKAAQSVRPQTVEKYSQLFEDMVFSGKNFSSLDEIY